MILAVLMLTIALAACKKDAGTGTADSTGSNVTGEGGGEGGGSVSTDPSGNGIQYDENGFQMDKLGKMDFGGKVLNVLTWSELSYPEFDVASDETNKTKLHEAVYIRDMKVKARMNLSFKYTYSSSDDGVYMTDALALATENAVDLFAPYSRNAATLMVQGFTMDMSSLPHVDYTAPWWSQNMIETASIYDRLYFVSGDIAPSLFGHTYMIFFNKKMAEQYLGEKLAEYGAESLYDLANSGKWTLETMIELSRGIGTEFSGSKDENDTYGFSIDPIYVDAFYPASNLKSLERNPDTTLVISDDMGSAKAHELVKTLTDFFDTPDAICANDYGTPEQAAAIKAFKNGNALFHMTYANQAPSYSDLGLEFGLLPVPKYDEEQESYISVSGFPFTMWSVSRNAFGILDAVGAGLECMASEAYRTMSPAMYEDMFRLQSSEGLDEYNMWETIKKSMIIDAGRSFATQFDNWTWQTFRIAVMKRTDYMSYYSGKKDGLNSSATTLNNIMYSIESVYGG